MQQRLSRISITVLYAILVGVILALLPIKFVDAAPLQQTPSTDVVFLELAPLEPTVILNDATSGTDFVYEITIRNTTVTMINNVVVTFEMPPNSRLAMEPFGSDLEGCTSLNEAMNPSGIVDPIFFCSLDSILPISNETFYVPVTIDNNAVACQNSPTALDTTLMEVNWVDFAGDDFDNGVDAALLPVEVAVQCATDISLQMNGPDSAALGDTVTYSMTVINNSAVAVAAGDLDIDAALPAELAGPFAIADAGTCAFAVSPTPDRYTSAAALPAGASCSLSLQAAVGTEPALCADGIIFETVNAEATNGANSYVDQVSWLTQITCDGDTGGGNNGNTDLQATLIAGGNGQIQAGETFTFTTFIDNLSDADVTDVELSTILFADGDFTLSSVTDSAGGCAVAPVTGASTTYTCTLASLVGLDRWTITILGTANQAISLNANVRAYPNPQTDPDLSNNVANAYMGVTDSVDLVVAQTVSAGIVDPQAGEAVSWDVIVTNNGPSPVQNVVLNQLLPDALMADSVAATVAGGACTIGTLGDINNPSVCSLGELTSGDARTIIFSGVVDPSYVADNPAFAAGDILLAEAWATSDTPEANNANNRASATVALGASVDIGLTKAASTAAAQAGNQIGYTIVVQNNGGPSTAENVQVSDALPAGVTFVSATVIGGTGAESCAYAGGSNTVNCSLGNMLPDTTLIIDLLVTVNPNAVTSSLLAFPIVNEATVTSVTAHAPTTAGDETDTAEVDVTAEAVLVVTKTASNAAPQPGEVIVYTINVTNQGPSTAFNVTALDALPPTIITYLSDTLTPNCVSGAGSSLTCTLGDLAPGQSISFDISTQLDGSAAHGIDIANSVQVNSDTTTTPATAAANSVVNASADLRIDQSVLPGIAAEVGQPYTFTITVDNLGPSAATATELIHELASTGTFSILDASSDLDPCLPNAAAGVTDVTITCTLADPLDGTLPEGDRWTITVVAVSDVISQLTSEARTTAREPIDASQENNFSQTSVDIVGRVIDLSTSVSTPSQQVQAGETFTYTIFVDNLGPSAAGETVMTNLLFADAAFTLENVVDDQGVCALTAPAIPATGASQTFDCTIPDLDPFERWTIQVAVSADVTADIVNDARVSSATADDANPDNNNDSTSVNVGEAADLAVTLTADAATVPAGDVVNYTIEVTNNGPSEATNASVTQQLPAAVTVGTLPGGCGQSPVGEQILVTCNIGTMANGQAANFVIPVTTSADGEGTVISQASVSSDAVDSNNANNVSSTDVTLAADADVSVTIQESAATVNAGEQFSYAVVVSNIGTSTADDVTLLHTLEEGITLISADIVGSPLASCSTSNASPPTVSCALGNLQAGGLATVNVTAQVDADLAVGTILESTAVVASPTESVAVVGLIDPATKTANNTATSGQTTVGGAAVLGITKSVSDDSPATGSIIHYVIEVTNSGPSAAADVQVVDTLPAQVAYLYDTSAAGCTAGAGTDLNCPLGTIQPGEARSFEIYVRVDTDIDSGTQLINNSTADSPVSDPVSTSIGMVAESVADLAVRVYGRADIPIQAGETVEYTILIDNFGPGVAQNVSLNELITADSAFTFSGPAICTPASGSPAGPPDEGSQAIVCALGDMQPNTRQELVIEVTPSDQQLVQNIADVSSESTDPDTSNNSATAANEIVTAADLNVTKSGPASVNAGGTVVYNIAVNNLGPSSAENVVVYDRLPAGVVVQSITPPAGSTCTGGTPGDAADPLTCGLGTLASTDSALVIVEVLTNTDLPENLVLSNDAYATSDTYDPNSDNDYANALTTVETTAGLSVATTLNPTPEVIAGSELQIASAVANIGPSVAANVALETTLPDGVTVNNISIINHSGTCTLLPALPQQIRCDLGQVPAGKTVDVIATATVDSDTNDGDLLVHVSEVASDSLDNDNSNNRSTTQVTVATLAELVITNSMADPSPLAGGDATFTVQVTNVGSSTARSVTVLDELPADYSYVLSTVSCIPAVSGDNTWACDLGDIPVGDSVSFDIVAEVSPDAVCDTPVTSTAAAAADNAPVTADAIITSSPSCMSDLRVTKYGNAASQLQAGEALTYTIVVDNLGPAAAHSVVLTDSIVTSGFFDIVRVVADAEGRHPNATCDVNSALSVDKQKTITCELGAGTTLPVFDPFTGKGRWMVNVVVVATEAQSITNVATVLHAHADPSGGNNVATTQHEVTSAADLTISASIDRAIAVAGDVLSYTLSATNLGPSPAANVVVIDKLPAGLTLQNIENALGGCVVDTLDATASQVSCYLGDLAANATANLVVNVMVDPDLPQNHVLAHSALVVADSYDTNNANNGVDLLTTVIKDQQLILSKTASAGPSGMDDTATDATEVVVGTPFEFVIEMINAGSSTANEVSFTDELPAGIRYLGFSTINDAGSCAYAAGSHVVSCGLATLASGTAWTVNLHVQLDPALDNGVVLNNILTNSDSRIDPASDLDESVVAVSQADLAIAMLATDMTPAAGQLFSYEIAVTNDGPSVARDVTVNGILPGGVAYVQDTLACGDALASCELGNIAPGESRGFTIIAQAREDVTCGEALLGQATVAAATEDPDESNNLAGTTLAATCATDLRVITFGQADGQVRAGETLVYTMIVDNLGPGYAHDATLTQRITSDGVFEIVAVNADVAGNRPGAFCDTDALAGINGSHTLVCRLDDPLEPVGLAADLGRWTLEVTVRASEAQSFINVASVASSDDELNNANNADMTDAVVTSVADLAITSIGTPNPVAAGRTASYEITILNEGPSAAQNVLLVDQLPAGISLFGITPSQGSCVTGTPGSAEDRLTCGLGTLAVGDAATIDLQVKINNDLPNESILTNDAFVTSDVVDNDNSDNYSNVITAVEARSQLLIEKTAADGVIAAGETLAYAVSVFNDGPSLAQDLIFSDLLPQDVELLGSRVSFGDGSCAYDPVGHALDCSLGNLSAGRLHKIIIEVQVDPSAADGTNLINSLFWPEDPVLLFHPDSDLEEITQVEAWADLAVSQTPSELRPAAGGNILYNISVVNQGPSNAAQVRVSELLPFQTKYLIDTINCGPGLTDCVLGDMAPNTERTFQVLVEVDVATDCDVPVNATATVSSGTVDPLTDNNSATAGIAPLCGADLRIVAVGDAIGSAIAGEPLVYTLIVDNLGPGYAHDVAIVDELIADKPFEIRSIAPDVNGNRSTALCSDVPQVNGIGNRQTVTCDLNDTLEPFKSSVISAQSLMASVTSAQTTGINIPTTDFDYTPGTGRWIVEVAVQSDERLDITNVAAVTASDQDDDTDNNLAILEHGVECVTYGYPDVSLIKEALNPIGPNDGFGPGQDITYKLAYANNTVDPAPCAAIIETVPNLTYFNAFESTPGWSCLDAAPAGTTCVYDLGTIEGGDANIIDFVVTVEDDVTDTSVITNTATIRMASIEQLPPQARSSANALIDPDNTAGEEGDQPGDGPGSNPPLTPTDLDAAPEPGRVYLPFVGR